VYPVAERSGNILGFLRQYQVKEYYRTTFVRYYGKFLTTLKIAVTLKNIT
jgi:hypothetical protein